MPRRSFFQLAAAILIAGTTRISVGCAAPPPPGPNQWIYVEDLERLVAIGRWHGKVAPGVFQLGNLDRNGDFIPSQIGIKSAAIDFQGVPVRLINGALVNPSGKLADGEKAYEYRSGRLTLGRLMTDGIFIPELDSKVTRFEDYVYSPEAPRIWNLPGTYWRRSQIEGRLKWLADHMKENPDAYGKEKARLDAVLEKHERQ
jgi:hypothetical protein